MWRRITYLLTGAAFLFIASKLLMKDAEGMHEVTLMAALLSFGFGGVIFLLLSVAPDPKLDDGNG